MADDTRVPYIDMLRGWAIALVVLGHAGQRAATYIPPGALSRAVFSFGYWHMALLMALSGYLAWGRVPRRPGLWLVDKARMLLVPFAAWTLLYYWIPDPFITKGTGLVDYLTLTIRAPGNTFWYFYVLFLCYAVLALALSLGEGALFAAGLLLGLLPAVGFGVDLLSWYWWWFILGYFMSKHSRLLVRSRWPLWVASAAGYCILLIGDITPDSITTRVLWAFAGIGVSTGVVAFMNARRWRGLLSALGQHSFVIYPAEFAFFFAPAPAGLLRIPVHTVIALVGSIGLEAMLRRIPGAAFLLLGSRPPLSHTSEARRMASG